MADQNQPPQNQGQQGQQRANNRGTNLSQQDRSRGGQHSAQSQVRDASGQFAGKKSGSSDRPSTSADWRDERSPATHSGAAASEGKNGPKLPNEDPDDQDVSEVPETDEDDVADDADVDETEDHSSVNARSASRNRVSHH